MASRDLLDYIDDNDVQLGYTPNRQSNSSANKLRLSSSRKSIKFRKLYTPRDSSNADGAIEPVSKRRRLSLASHNATIGNASHIDSSLDVVDVTPGIDVLKSLTFQSYLLNQTSLQNPKSPSKVTQGVVPLCDVGNRNEYTPKSTINIVEKRNAGETERAVGSNINGITSLWKSPVPVSNRNVLLVNSESPFPSNSNISPDRCSISSSSTLSDVLVKSRRSLQVRRRRRTLYSPNKNDGNHVFPEKKTIFETPEKTNYHDNQGAKVAVQLEFGTPSKAAEPEFEDAESSMVEMPSQANYREFRSSAELTPQVPGNEGKEPEVILKTPSDKTGEATKKTEAEVKTFNNDKLLMNRTAVKPIATNSIKKANFNDEDLPPTQPILSLLFKDVIAYVEVRTGGDNRSRGIKAHLRSFGATVRDKFTNDVTHVVFNEGLLSTYKKAVKKKIPLVSVLWIEECKKAQKLVPERLYPPCDMERYESPNLFKKFRKVKSLQPDFEDEGDKVRRRRKKTIPQVETEIELPELPFYKKRIKVPGFLESASNQNGMVRALLSVADIGPEDEEIVNRAISPTLSEEEDLINPPTLAVRLLRKMLTPKSSPDVNSREGTADELTQTPKSKNGLNSEETPVKQLLASRKRSNFINYEENNDSPKGSNGTNNITTSQLCTINENNVISSPVVKRSENPILHKLPDGILENNERTGRELNAIAIPSTSGVTASLADNPEENSSKHNLVNNIQKAVKRRYSTLADIAAKISVTKCGKSPAASSTSHSKMNEQAVSKNNKKVQSNSLKPRKEDGKDPKEKSLKKRKLLTLRQTETSEELSVSNVDEESIAVSQCPYSPEVKLPRKQRKSVAYEDNPNPVPMDLTDCVSATANSQLTGTRKIKKARKKFNISPKSGLELVGKAGCSSRGSSGEFVVTAPAALTQDDERPQKVAEKKLSSLVCTGLQRHELEVVASVVQNLGGFVIEAKVSAHTSHVVTSGPKRTLNLLKGIARGSWIVLQEWVLRSVEAGKWLEEEPFELQDFSPAVQQCRIQRLSFGRFYKQDLFRCCGPIFVSNKCVPPKQDLEELIRLCGGHVVSACRSAKLLVGRGCTQRYDKLKHVSEKWILDSVQYCELKSADDYETS